jgi:hypothetical protein
MKWRQMLDVAAVFNPKPQTQKKFKIGHGEDSWYKLDAPGTNRTYNPRTISVNTTRVVPRDFRNESRSDSAICSLCRFLCVDSKGYEPELVPRTT